MNSHRVLRVMSALALVAALVVGGGSVASAQDVADQHAGGTDVLGQEEVVDAGPTEISPAGESPETAGASTLPVTGSDMTGLFLIGGAALVGGAVLAAAARRARAV